MKYLIIDGNNLAIRSAFANGELQNRDGIPTGVHYGVFQSLRNLGERFPDYQFLIVWDGKSVRRISEANIGVTKGLIRSGYKANRLCKPEEQRRELKDFYDQAPYLKKGIHQAGIPQIRIHKFEADDVVSAYCKLLRDDNEIVLVTSDKDYFQLLHPNVRIWDGMKNKMTVENEWTKETNISPSQFIDVGALMGDTTDNIFGLPSWGEKTSLKAIQKSGSYQAVLKELHDQYDNLRVTNPDITDENEFKRLSEMKTPKEKFKYPEININMPFTGVAMAIEDKKIKAIPKTALMALIFEERVPLAYSLKKMDDDIDGLPEIKGFAPNRNRLLEYFDYYDMESLKDEIDQLI